MEPEVFDDLRQFIDASKKVSEWREIKGAETLADELSAMEE